MVNMQIFSRYQVNVDLSDVERILRQPGPSVLRSDVHYDASKERQVLYDMERGRKEEEEKNDARRLRIQKYEEENTTGLKLHQQKKKVPEDPKVVLILPRPPLSPKKISKSGHWGILRKVHFCIFTHLNTIWPLG